jgi:hypothetical protein
VAALIEEKNRCVGLGQAIKILVGVCNGEPLPDPAPYLPSIRVPSSVSTISDHEVAWDCVGEDLRTGGGPHERES